MKKVMFLGVVALLGLSSCKKDWTCECTATIGSVSTKGYIPLTNQTKSSAKTNCDAYSNTYGQSVSMSGGTYSCELK